MSLMARLTVLLLVSVAIAAGCERRASTPPTADQPASPSANAKPVSQPMPNTSNTPPSDSQPAQVKVYLNPLVILLAGAERQKGQPLTREEVLKVRDTAVSVMMSPEQAQKFYNSLDSKVPVYRMNPDRVWEEWQEIRTQVK